MNVRPATHADTARLAELSAQWADEGITIGQQPDDQEWFEAAIGSYFLVAENDGDIVGFAQGEELVSDERHTAVLPAGTRYLDVTNVYVVPRLRSSGVGGALLDELLDRAARQGIERSMVYSAASELDRVVAFYREHGFRGWFVQLVR
ncbi:MAG TPA: GNAT family N-acetyltransferase [Mycobacteriales bacterium]|nr:GNAT family N-acetyltransferase [Mycobacteriales bacterium]